MTDVGRMSVAELVGKVLADEHADGLRQAVCWLAEELMEAEVSQRAGAGYGERSGDRVARRRSEQALVAVVQEAYVNGVSTPKVDRLVEAWGWLGCPRTPFRGSARAWMSRSPCSGSGPWRAPTRICGWTPRWRRSGPAGGSSTMLWWSPTGSTPAGRGRSSAWRWARPRPRRSGGSSWGSLVRRGLQGPVGHLRRPPGPQAGHRPGAGCAMATLHGAFLARCPRPLPKDLQQLVGAAIRPIFRAANLQVARRLLDETVTHLEGRVPRWPGCCWRPSPTC
jgi:putative transposase